jgi:hypothetical protein
MPGAGIMMLSEVTKRLNRPIDQDHHSPCGSFSARPIAAGIYRIEFRTASKAWLAFSIRNLRLATWVALGRAF